MNCIEVITKQLGVPLETVSKAIEFMGDLVGPTLKELSLIPFDAVREFRYRRQIQILTKTRQYCLENNIRPNEIGLKNLVSLLEAATLEENENIFELWTNLLINSTTNSSKDNEFMSSYIAILKQLSPVEAAILDCIYNKDSLDVNSKETYELLQLNKQTDKRILSIAFNNLSRMSLVFDEGETMHIGYLEDRFRNIAESCESIIIDSRDSTTSGPISYEIAELLKKNLSKIDFNDYTGVYRLSFLGISFIKACTKKEKNK